MEDLPRRVQALEQEVHTLLGINSGLVTAVTALIKTHHNHPAVMHQLMALTEVGDGGSLGATMDVKQREAARLLLESLQRIEA